MRHATLSGLILASVGCQAADAPRQRGASPVVFRRVMEPREQAFSILVPDGWVTEGGILRVNPTTGGGALNAIGAKVDFAVKKDAAGTVAVRSLPDYTYFDMRRSPAAPMFPAGSNYNGAQVFPVMDAATFLLRLAVPYAHPRARNVQVVEKKPLPELVRKIGEFARAMPPANMFRYDAAVLTITYQEDGRMYKERLFTVIEDMGQAGAGLWGNKEACYYRAPPEEFDRWAKIAFLIKGSAQIDTKWLAGEIRGQAERGDIAMRTQRYIQNIDRQIVEHRQRTNAEINNDMFLTLTGKEEYVNPHTKQVEIGTNEWKNRWVTPSGDVVYTDDSYYDPNHDPNLKRTDFRRSPVRPR